MAFSGMMILPEEIVMDDAKQTKERESCIGEIKLEEHPKVAKYGKWQPDETSTKCTKCQAEFGIFLFKHHCRACGSLVCDPCSQATKILKYIGAGGVLQEKEKRICDSCVDKYKDQSVVDMTPAGEEAVPCRLSMVDAARAHAEMQPIAEEEENSGEDGDE
jgi:hypothetical protein